MQGIIYEESSVWLFLLVTCVIGGAGAWLTGKAAAQNWQPVWMLIVYLLGLGIAVRFVHHALFDGTMFSLKYFISDTIILMVIGLTSYLRTRTKQMVTQYRWLYEQAGPLNWRPIRNDPSR